MTYENCCKACGRKFEWLARHYDSPDPACPQCAGVTERLFSAPAVIWTKRLADYGSPNKESWKKDQRIGGHCVMETKSDQAIETGKPVRRFLETVADQNAYCRSEGLMRPSDIPSNLSIAKDGMSYQTANRSEV